MRFIKSCIQGAMNAIGYNVRRISGRLGHDPYLDMGRFVAAERRPVLFDVGANLGQTIVVARSRLRRPIIHAFEPSPATFLELQRRSSEIPDLTLNNCGVGSEAGFLSLIENTCCDMSSFLEPGADIWGEVRNRVRVPVCTIDDYCSVGRNITAIDILKSDTQGFDLEVLRGASGMLSAGRIQQVFLEVTFGDLYKKLPRLDEIYGFLADRGFELVSFYTFQYRNNRAGSTDALFVNPKFRSDG